MLALGPMLWRGVSLFAPGFGPLARVTLYPIEKRFHAVFFPQRIDLFHGRVISQDKNTHTENVRPRRYRGVIRANNPEPLRTRPRK